MAELADAADSKSADLRVLGVRLPLPAPSPKAHRIRGQLVLARMRWTSETDAADFASYYSCE
jgi:hypothetical protein